MARFYIMSGLIASFWAQLLHDSIFNNAKKGSKQWTVAEAMTEDLTP
jgi:hypothetical protein